VGVNLRGLGREAVSRGGWLVAPELAGRASRRFDAWVKLLPGARPLRAGLRVRLHHGTAQYQARIAPIEGRELAPGTEGAAVVRLDAAAPVEPHDRFVLRALSPVETIGGGEVLAIGARRWREAAAQATFLAAALSGDVRAAARALAADRGLSGFTAADLAAAGFGAGEAGPALAAAEKAGELEALRAGGAEARWFGAGGPAALRAALLAGAAGRASERPERPFTAAAELAALTPALQAAEVDALLKELAAAGELVSGEGGYAPAGGVALGGADEALAAELLERLRVDPLAPPTLAGLAEAVRRPARELARVLDVLARRGELVRADKDLWFAREAVDEAREHLSEMLQTSGEVTLAAYRDRLACGRRNAQALLELFDREGLTLRRGDVRVARRRR
jgi:selenocysteine-specific elongation factor